MRLDIFICEDDEQQRMRLNHYIEDYLDYDSKIKNVEMNLRVSSPNPYEILNVVKSNTISGLYFLDIDLNTDINGMDLANEIRKYDKQGEIVFITTFAEMMPLTFEYKLKALAYIIKDEITKIEAKVVECLDLINDQYQSISIISNKPTFNFTTNEKTIREEYENILFFEKIKGSNRIKMQTTNGFREFNGTIGEIEEMNDCLIRCNHGIIVNINNITEFNIKKREIELKGGFTCPTSVRLTKKLKEVFEQNLIFS